MTSLSRRENTSVIGIFFKTSNSFPITKFTTFQFKTKNTHKEHRKACYFYSILSKLIFPKKNWNFLNTEDIMPRGYDG